MSSIAVEESFALALGNITGTYAADHAIMEVMSYGGATAAMDATGIGGINATFVAGDAGYVNPNEPWYGVLKRIVSWGSIAGYLSAVNSVGLAAAGDAISATISAQGYVIDPHDNFVRDGYPAPADDPMAQARAAIKETGRAVTAALLQQEVGAQEAVEMLAGIIAPLAQQAGELVADPEHLSAMVPQMVEQLLDAVAAVHEEQRQAFMGARGDYRVSQMSLEMARAANAQQLTLDLVSFQSAIMGEMRAMGKVAGVARVAIQVRRWRSAVVGRLRVAGNCE